MTFQQYVREARGLPADLVEFLEYPEFPEPKPEAPRAPRKRPVVFEIEEV